MNICRHVGFRQRLTCRPDFFDLLFSCCYCIFVHVFPVETEFMSMRNTAGAFTYGSKGNKKYCIFKKCTCFLEVLRLEQFSGKMCLNTGPIWRLKILIVWICLWEVKIKILSRCIWMKDWINALHARFSACPAVWYFVDMARWRVHA